MVTQTNVPPGGDSREERMVKLLEETLRHVEASHQMLRKMRRAAAVGQVFGVLKFLVVSGVLVASFFYLQPILGQVMGRYQQIQQQFDQFNSALRGGPR